MVQCNLLIVEPHMADMWLERISPQLLAVLQTPSHSKTHSINTVYSMDTNKNECPEKLHSINADVHHNTYAFVDYEVGNTNRHTPKFDQCHLSATGDDVKWLCQGILQQAWLTS